MLDSVLQSNSLNTDNFDLKVASKRIERLMHGVKEKRQWKYEGDRLSLEDGEFDYDISVLAVDENLEEL